MIKCYKCKYWSWSSKYDSGSVGICKHTHVTGRCHPSYGFDIASKTMMILSRMDHEYQDIYTRSNFGCILGEENEKELSGERSSSKSSLEDANSSN